MADASNGAAAETAGGGSTILRHQDRPLEYRESARRPKHFNEILEQLRPLLGERYVIDDLGFENVVKVDLILFPPAPDRDNWTIVTVGMSDRPMTVAEALSPDEQKSFELAELTISLPSDAFSIDATGRIAEGELRKGPHAWIVANLAILAHLPHDYRTWLGVGHSIPNGDPAEPYTSYVPFSGVIIASPLHWAERYRTIASSEGPINILAVVPVYEDEMNFLLAKGFDALHAELEAFGYTEVMSETRPNIGKVLSLITK
ncbi:suppressor of fused domain protein [Allomesorhizobium alhagi]|jgi:hypothetical protein|uniref:Suppressor of fused-like domain-containing protein n=1 Tax=Mesorhizobium alhagi CCNWXJ12-2 TaxID=1107882 RepID=H0HL98_9HYPH|nr:suppressor of fused domain protein [Mesorhizobium alhagi]EHK58498.1 hypothetical protein MAXJ12_04544 [Mesorhizobium alhagi CCNWXJ12-2]